MNGPDIRPRIEAIHDRIASAGGDPARLTVVAVTKGFGPETVAAALDAGLVDIGESYAQELATKVAALGPGAGIRWHFLGRLQSNKVRLVADAVACWHSVDRRSLGDEVARRAPGARVLAQVNVSGEPQKGGCAFGEVEALVDHLTGLGLDVTGLMGIGPAGAPEQARPGFRRLVELADRLGLPDRSIGMSDDLEVAVAEGSTMVRIGRALFGERPGPRAANTQVRH